MTPVGDTSTIWFPRKGPQGSQETTFSQPHTSGHRGPYVAVRGRGRRAFVC